MDDAALAEPSWCGAGGSAGDHPALASRWFQDVLAQRFFSAHFFVKRVKS
jgi:hypothetical protein